MKQSRNAVILKTERRKIILERRDDVLKPKGYEREISQGDVTYTRFDENTCDGFFLDFTSAFVTLRYLGHGMIEVESIMSEITDEQRLLSYNEKSYLPTTFTDPTFTRVGDAKAGDDFSIKAKAWCGLESVEIVQRYCDWLTNYFVHEYPNIVAHYSYLPNILQKMNELESKNIDWGIYTTVLSVAPFQICED